MPSSSKQRNTGGHLPLPRSQSSHTMPTATGRAIALNLSAVPPETILAATGQGQNSKHNIIRADTGQPSARMHPAGRSAPEQIRCERMQTKHKEEFRVHCNSFITNTSVTEVISCCRTQSCKRHQVNLPRITVCGRVLRCRGDERWLHAPIGMRQTGSSNRSVGISQSQQVHRGNVVITTAPSKQNPNKPFTPSPPTQAHHN